jgi:hypothetical protein
MIGRKLQDQIDFAYKELGILKEDPPGSGAWRMQRRYIDGLEWALEELKLDEREVKALEDISDRLLRLDETLKLIARAIDAGTVFS